MGCMAPPYRGFVTLDVFTCQGRRRGPQRVTHFQRLSGLARPGPGRQNGVYLPNGTNPPTTLLGFPVAIDENIPNIAANALPVAFGGVVTLSSAGATRCPSAGVRPQHRPRCATPQTR